MASVIRAAMPLKTLFSPSPHKRVRVALIWPSEQSSSRGPTFAPHSTVLRKSSSRWTLGRGPAVGRVDASSRRTNYLECTLWSRSSTLGRRCQASAGGSWATSNALCVGSCASPRLWKVAIRSQNSGARSRNHSWSHLGSHIRRREPLDFLSLVVEALGRSLSKSSRRRRADAH